MPFYEYECSACKFYVEALQKISDPPIKKCPSCKKQTMKKLVSAPVFRLKGGGWYETDFKSDQDNKRNLVASDDKEAPAEKKEDSKSDPKPESTEASKPTDTKSAESAVSQTEKSPGRKATATRSKKPAKTKPKAKPAAKKK